MTIREILARFRARSCLSCLALGSVSGMAIDPELVERVMTSTGLSAREAERVVEDVVAFHAEPVETYVRRRHRELKNRGAKNDAIFVRLGAEMGQRVFSPPPLTERQLRRMIYG